MKYFTSDLHLNHDRDFIWGKRGFNNVVEMNESIIQNWNNKVTQNDIVYVLGDIMLGNNEEGIKLFKQLNGWKYIILGNHDTDARIAEYKKIFEVIAVTYAYRLREGQYTFYLSHYPTYVENKNDRPVWCLSGHTHSKEIFQSEFPHNYNVALDAHKNNVVSIAEILQDIKTK